VKSCQYYTASIVVKTFLGLETKTETLAIRSFRVIHWMTDTSYPKKVTRDKIVTQ